jgi:predicted dienelactone hydrolase
VKSVKVRAFYRAATVAGCKPPYDNLTMKVYYPCCYGNSFEERNTGFIPADSSLAPFPVVVIMPGINVSHEAYGWLARKLARAGFAVVSYSWIAEEMPGFISVTPGVDIQALMHSNYGQRHSCPALPALLEELVNINTNSLLSGKLDLTRIVLGGHSAGGTMALLNARSDWFPGICGAFAYAAHTAANVQLGWEADSIMPLSTDLPMLIMGGSRDGVIAASSHRYGDDADSTPSERIERTFQEGLGGERGDRYLAIVEGANHFSLVHPRDDSTGRPFLDWQTQGSKKSMRRYIGQLLTAFCNSACRKDNAAARQVLDTLCNSPHPLAAVAATK